jgi:uncharacterized membrane protein HdeD (DUF308 family)
METAMLAKTWWVLAARGVIAIIFGVLTLLLPGVTLATLILLFGCYAIVDGIFSIIAAVRHRVGERRWWTLLLEGLASIGAGIVTFAFPGLTTIVLLWVIAVWTVVTGVLEIITAIRLRHEITGEGWLTASGVLSIAFGVLLMIAPAAGALALVLWIGAYAVVFGAFLLVLAFRLRGKRVEVRRVMPRAA